MTPRERRRWKFVAQLMAWMFVAGFLRVVIPPVNYIMTGSTTLKGGVPFMERWMDGIEKGLWRNRKL